MRIISHYLHCIIGFTQAEYCELKSEADKLSIEIEILQKALDYLNISRRSRLQFSEEIYSLYSSRVIAEALKINRSTLYHHINHNKNENAWFYKYEERMKSETLKVYAEHNGSICMDLFSRKVLSIRISPNNSTRLSKSTLVVAIQNRDIKPGLILHSDRGSNFISYTYNKYLKDHHIIHSYSRPSTPTDNAPLESFNRTLKDAILLNEAGKSYSTVRKHISKFMDYYNNKRPHSSLNYLSPNEYEDRYQAGAI